MIQTQTKLKVADNTGAKVVECIKVLGGSKRRYAQLGDLIVVAVKKAQPRGEVQEHEVARAVVVRQKKKYRRKDGTYIRFDDNAVVILDEAEIPKGNRIMGPVAREVKEKGFDEITSLAKEVI